MGDRIFTRRGADATRFVPSSSANSFSRNRDWIKLTTALRSSEIDSKELREGLTQEAVEELHADEDSEFTEEDFDEEEVWADASRRPLFKGEVRIVDEVGPE